MRQQYVSFALVSRMYDNLNIALVLSSRLSSQEREVTSHKIGYSEWMDDIARRHYIFKHFPCTAEHVLERFGEG